jgi:hypothetical protein
MKSKLVFYFADDSDLSKYIRQLDSSVSKVEFYKAGMFDTPEPEFGMSLSEMIKNETIHSDWNHNTKVLVLPTHIDLVIRKVPQRNGVIRYAIDQREHPSSIILKIGGIHSEGILIAGAIGTINNDEISISLFKEFTAVLKKQSKKIGSFYVAEGAYEKLKNNWRLTTNSRSPKEYDLSLTAV